MKCDKKKKYMSRMAASAALNIARSQWRRAPGRAEGPPTRIYLCPRCEAWHLTHSPEKEKMI